MKRILFALALSVLAVACSTPKKESVGQRTDALDPSCWDASQWISVVDAPIVEGKIDGSKNWRAADGANWFVATVKNDKKVASAKWMTAGLGVYELYLNGRTVGTEALKPGFTHNQKTKRSFTYDLTEDFNRGAGKENVLSAQVTPGWWGDMICTPNGWDGMIGHKCAFRAVLELIYEDGSKELFGTDCQNWKAGIAGPVKHAGIFDGEEYDARELPGYDTPEKLSTPEVSTEFPGEILPSDGAEVYLRRDLAMAPVKAYLYKDIEDAKEEEYGKIVVSKEFAAGEIMEIEPGDTLVIDFGQNAAAVPQFTFKADEGTVLTCLPGELLNDGNGAKSRGMDGPEGSVHRTNLRTPELGMRLIYTFGPGKDYISYYPHCTFYGYRFVSITATGKVSIKEIESVPVSSITKEMEIGTITTGNELINKLISNTIWGQRSNYLSVPTDCPQRNERLGWTADTQVFTETGTFFANTDKFFHKWLKDLRDTQTETGAYPGVAPWAQYGALNGNMMRFGWADAGIIVPWTVWKQFGDSTIVDESWASMELFMSHINENQYNHEKMSWENDNYQWADWLSYEPLESCGGGAFYEDAKSKWNRRPETIQYWNYLGASYWALDATLMADMARATGRDAAKYESMAKAAKTYLKDKFLNVKDGTFKTEIFNTMQTPALFALKNNLLEEDAKEVMKQRLRDNFDAHDGCLQTGFLGTSILMDVLTENGMSDVAYDLLFQRKNPSWLYSVDNGATTIWERWNSYTIENGMGPKGMNSFNHYAYGCVCAWIWKTAAGIAADPEQPGFKHIIMKPVPDTRLGSIDATYNSAAGTIKSAWHYDGDDWIWNFTIPEGATASVVLPGSTEAKEYKAGSYRATLKNSKPHNRIGIAWRGDEGAEKKKAVARAIEAAGGIAVPLGQIKADGFDYEGSTLKPEYTDENGILLQLYADIVKNDTYNGSNAEEVLADIDAVVLTGGGDVSPTLFKEPEPWHGLEEDKNYDATRDVSEYLTLAYCLDNDIPVLGLCRGMQYIGIVSGATLTQDIPTYYKGLGKNYSYQHRNQLKEGKTYRDYAAHDVYVTDHESLLYQIEGKDVIKGVPSWHHQAIISVTGTPLKATAVSTFDGVDIIEAVERMDKTFVLGVQYHPEAAVVKYLDGKKNASDYMPLDDALNYFRKLISVAESR